MDESSELQIVITHLKNLAKALSAENLEVGTRRSLIDEYFNLNHQFNLPSHVHQHAEKNSQTLTELMIQTATPSITPIKVNAAGVVCSPWV